MSRAWAVQIAIWAIGLPLDFWFITGGHRAVPDDLLPVAAIGLIVASNLLAVVLYVWVDPWIDRGEPDRMLSRLTDG